MYYRTNLKRQYRDTYSHSYATMQQMLSFRGAKLFILHSGQQTDHLFGAFTLFIHA